MCYSGKIIFPDKLKVSGLKYQFSWKFWLSDLYVALSSKMEHLKCSIFSFSIIITIEYLLSPLF